MVKEARNTGVTVPIVLMGYYNPLLIYGEERIVNAAKKAGADGFIVVDLPTEEAVSFRNHCIDAGFLIPVKLQLTVLKAELYSPRSTRNIVSSAVLIGIDCRLVHLRCFSNGRDRFIGHHNHVELPSGSLRTSKEVCGQYAYCCWVRREYERTFPQRWKFGRRSRHWKQNSQLN